MKPIIPWEEFRKQLDPQEEKVWEHIRYMAKSLGEPQQVLVCGVATGIVWPSGAISLYELESKTVSETTIRSKVKAIVK